MNNYWNYYIESIYKQEKRRNVLKKYVSTLESNGFPVILNFRHLSFILELERYYLAAMINSTKSYYRSFFIPKRRSGEFREIHSPYPVLKFAQNWIFDHILSKIPLSDHCYSYRKNLSILDNASKHLNTTALYKLDIRNFFPSVNLRRVMAVFLNCGYTYKVSYYLSALCTLNDGLPQGAPTSPQLSNIICKRLDNRLNSLSMKHFLNYSRYADDLTFSGKFISPNFRAYTRKIIESEGFEINFNKELLIAGIKKKKIVTGISITNGKVLKLPRAYKRQIKLDTHKFIYYNYKVNPTISDFDPLFPDRLIGKLVFWKQVEKTNEKVDSLITKVKHKIDEINSVII